MYPDKATRDKRMHMIDLQLEALDKEKNKVIEAIIRLNNEKTILNKIEELEAGENIC